MKILVVIPARGGSKGIPRKNVRLLNGKPLISYAINVAKQSQYKLDICVSTEDEEISRIALFNDVSVIDRPGNLSDDKTTLDPVIYDAYQKMLEKNNGGYDIIITLQPTSPLLSVDTLDSAISQIINQPEIDTLISAVNNPHLAWTYKDGEYYPKYEERVNRQYLPKNLSETGAFLITRSSSISEKSRIGERVSVYEMPEYEAIDIDTAKDWWVAETELSKKNIYIRVEGYKQIGLGHVYRGLSLAYGLIRHNIHFVVSEKSDLAIQKIRESFFPLTIIHNDDDMIQLVEHSNVDIVINDMLNTSYDYIKQLKEKKVKVVNFEDLGNGAEIADAVINDLYAPDRKGEQYYWGSEYYILRDEFINSHPIQVEETVQNILVIFGGVDPNNLTKKVYEALPYIENNNTIHFNFIVGPGYLYFNELSQLAKKDKYNINIIQNVKDMSYYMGQADIAISSQGRTMLELASMGVPTILMAQNKRELTHEFGALSNGFINLGLGEELKNLSIASTINWLIHTPQIRKQMHKQMIRNNLKNGLEKVLKIIID